MDLKRTLGRLLVGLVLGPVAMLLTLGMAKLLSVLGDQAGGAWLARLAAVIAIVWLVDLVALVGVQGLLLLGCQDRAGSGKSPAVDE